MNWIPTEEIKGVKFQNGIDPADNKAVGRNGGKTAITDGDKSVILGIRNRRHKTFVKFF